MNTMLGFLLLLVCLTVCSGFFRVNVQRSPASTKSIRLYGFLDALKKGLENDSSLPPPKNPGLSNEAPAVEVEFLPSKKVVKAYLGQEVSMIAKAAGVTIKYSCKKGDCNTCEVNFNGKLVKACQSRLPGVSNAKKFTVGIPDYSKGTPAKKK